MEPTVIHYLKEKALTVATVVPLTQSLYIAKRIPIEMSQ